MTRAEILARYPLSSHAFIKANLDAGGTWAPAKPKPVALPSSHGDREVKAKDSRRFLVRVTDVRKRLLDDDNGVEKFHVDCLRYAGILPSDAPGQTTIERGQRKAGKGEQERVIIEVFEIL